MKTIISTCCRVAPIEDYRDNPHDHDDPIEIYTCTKCKQECDTEFVCEYCLGEGTVSVDETDSDGNVSAGTGTEKCMCSIPDEEPKEEN